MPSRPYWGVKKPRPVDPSPRERLRVIQTVRHQVRAELVLEFDRPLSVLKANEAGRRLLDALTISAPGFVAPDELGQATIRVPQLRRIIRIPID